MKPTILIVIAILVLGVVIAAWQVGIVWIGGVGIIVAAVVAAILAKITAPRPHVEGKAAAAGIYIKDSIEEPAIVALAEWIRARGNDWNADTSKSAFVSKIQKMKPLQTAKQEFRSTIKRTQWFKIALVCNKGKKYLITITGEGYLAQEQIAGLASQIGIQQADSC